MSFLEQAGLDPAQQFVHDQQGLQLVPTEPEARQLEGARVAVVDVAPAGDVLDRCAQVVAQHADRTEQGRTRAFEFGHQLAGRGRMSPGVQHAMKRDHSLHPVHDSFSAPATGRAGSRGAESPAAA